MKPLSVLIVGGGTGGHLSPGIAVYEECRARGVEVYFLAGNNDRRFTYMSDVDSENLFYYNAPSLTRNIFKLPFFLIGFLWAVLRGMSYLGKLEISAVIGMGGYVSAPLLIAARIKGIPLYLCEQNSVPGKVTRYFAKYARAVFSTFEVTREYLKNGENMITVGNPIRKKVFVKATREEARAHFNMKHCRQVILAIGGSQGALKINELMLGLKKTFPGDFKDVGIIWSTGDYSYEKYKKLVQEELGGGSVFLSPFITNVGLAYLASDIAISRSGSGVMMELAAMGIPSILIPYPFAAQDHQNTNADEFVNAGAALKIMNDEAVPQKVGPVILDILNSRTQLARMSEKALAASRKNAAQDIVDRIAEFHKQAAV